jgi:restriction endonuclease S subunit
MKKTIQKLASVQMGYSFRSRLESADGGNVAVIQMKDLLDDNTVSFKDLVRIDMDSVKEHHLVQKGDLIFRSRGQVSTTAIVLEDPKRAIVAAPLLRIRVSMVDKVLPEYLNWYISQSDAQMFLTSRAGGTAQKMIGKETIEEMEIPLPPLEKQKNIIELASLIAKEKELLQTIAEKRGQCITSILMQVVKGE